MITKERLYKEFIQVTGMRCCWVEFFPPIFTRIKWIVN